MAGVPDRADRADGGMSGKKHGLRPTYESNFFHRVNCFTSSAQLPVAYDWRTFTADRGIAMLNNGLGLALAFVLALSVVDPATKELATGGTSGSLHPVSPRALLSADEADHGDKVGTAPTQDVGSARIAGCRGLFRRC
jgi:hypothetical protein